VGDGVKNARGVPLCSNAQELAFIRLDPLCRQSTDDQRYRCYPFAECLRHLHRTAQLVLQTLLNLFDAGTYAKKLKLGFHHELRDAQSANAGLSGCL
jgi:hypothetical protein